jgi:hypothetical protein
MASGFFSIFIGGGNWQYRPQLLRGAVKAVKKRYKGIPL